MSSLNDGAMRTYLSRSIASFNRNKLNGLLAEVDLRRHLEAIGFGDRISPGGWIARREGAGEFGHHTVVMFPEVLVSTCDYPTSRDMPIPPQRLHTICATFHQTGINAYFCSASVGAVNDPATIRWRAKQLGIPNERPAVDFPECLDASFRARERNYNFLRYHTDTAMIPAESVAEEFTKECLRIAFQSRFMAELSDVDGIFWGEQFTYPLEIKEKTAADSRPLGQYFGLDIGPFVKLAFYAAKRGNLHSLFIVREIDTVETRNLVNWWFITYDRLAQYASWVFQGGGAAMLGGQSAVVKIPKAEFTELNAANLARL